MAAALALALPIVASDGAARLGTFERVADPLIDAAAVRADIAKRAGGAVDPGQAASLAVGYHDRMRRAGAHWWRNSEYLVQAMMASGLGFASPDAPMLWLRIYRHDGERLPNHWRDLQSIKNELVGEEFEAVEIYPRESQLKDGENSYHLWVPIGWPLAFGIPGARAETVDGLPAISTRFVRNRPSKVGNL